MSPRRFALAVLLGVLLVLIGAALVYGVAVSSSGWGM